MTMVNIHATCVAIGRNGILLLGESGSGKSDLALRLIDGGAKLVADDRTELYAARGRLCARAPASISGLIEVRGLGIIALPFRANVTIALAVTLGVSSKRLPEPSFYLPPGSLKSTKPVPMIILDARLPSAPARIRLAVTAFTKDLFRGDFNPT
ncbi:MAG TPA: HPr kinase/phosphatase C-terminal domain-containing protein [Rhizomicrobium sp.]|jgi:serine kinase of HPr protein (carbohydrate metabolism regulator)